MPSIGALDRRLVIERATTEPDPRFNGPVETWAPIATVWTRVQRTPGREYLAGEQRTAESRAVFVVRYRDVVVTDRLIFEGDRWDIADVREVGRREWLEIHSYRSDADDVADGGSP